MKNDKLNLKVEKLNKIEQQRKQVEQEYKVLLHQQKRSDSKKKRRERSHRIATKGAMLEKYFDCADYSFDDTEKLLKMYADFVNQNKTEYFKEKYHNDGNSTRNEETS